MRSSACSLVLAWAALLLPGAARAESPVQVDADFPGGNILVQKVEGDTVSIAQDLRDTSEWWFYYSFRVRGAAGRELTFQWTNKDPMAALGPAVSLDEGKTWKWLGRGSVQGTAFKYRFPAEADSVRFCLAIPYQFDDFQRFAARHADNPSFRMVRHATTRKKREAPRLHVGRLDGQPRHRVLLTARHHSCEMIASYVLEGIVDEVLSDSEDGRWLRENVEFLAVPFMDLDGVEDGDQGKQRRPHDHNRDYEGKPLYPTVAANKSFVPEWSGGKLRIALDLHCPWVRGGGDSQGSNERIYFVGGPDAENWNEITRFSAFLEAGRAGELPFSPKHNLPWGVSWNNQGGNLNRSFGRWANTLPEVKVASTIEVPYATVADVPVTTANARAFGADVARAIRRYLETPGTE